LPILDHVVEAPLKLMQAGSLKRCSLDSILDHVVEAPLKLNKDQVFRSVDVSPHPRPRGRGPVEAGCN